MSSYKVVDSTISILYCAKCAGEHLEVVSPGRFVCPDCGNMITFDPKIVKVGQLTGTKYKMRAKRRYSFREIVDEARQDAFSEVYVPSPEPGRGQVGWRHERRKERSGGSEAALPAQAQAEESQIRMAGVDDHPGKGWRSEALIEMVANEALTQKDDDEGGNNGQTSGTCAL